MMVGLLKYTRGWVDWGSPVLPYISRPFNKERDYNSVGGGEFLDLPVAVVVCLISRWSMVIPKGPATWRSWGFRLIQATINWFHSSDHPDELFVYTWMLRSLSIIWNAYHFALVAVLAWLVLTITEKNRRNRHPALPDREKGYRKLKSKEISILTSAHT